MSSDPNIGPPASLGGGEAPSRGEGRGLPAPQAAQAIAFSVFNFLVWLSVRVVVVVAFFFLVFLGVDFVSGLEINGVFESAGGQVLLYALTLVSAVVAIWFFVAVFQFFISAVNGVRAGVVDETND